MDTIPLCLVDLSSSDALPPSVVELALVGKIIFFGLGLRHFVISGWRTETQEVRDGETFELEWSKLFEHHIREMERLGCPSGGRQPLGLRLRCSSRAKSLYLKPFS